MVIPRAAAVVVDGRRALVIKRYLRLRPGSVCVMCEAAGWVDSECPGHQYAVLPGGHVEGFFDTFCAHFRAVYDDVVAGRPSSSPGYPTFADGHDEMLVGEAIARSARDGRWVDVDRSAGAMHAPPTSTPLETPA